MGLVSLALTTTGAAAQSYASRETGATGPQLVVQTAPPPPPPATKTRTPTRTGTATRTSTPTRTGTPEPTGTLFVPPGVTSQGPPLFLPLVVK